MDRKASQEKTQEFFILQCSGCSRDIFLTPGKMNFHQRITPGQQPVCLCIVFRNMLIQTVVQHTQYFFYGIAYSTLLDAAAGGILRLYRFKR